MDIDDYKNLCDTIYEEIYKKLERKDDERLRFARRGTAKEVLNDKYLKHFLRSLAPTGGSYSDGLGLSEYEFVKRIHERKLHKFLAVLIFATSRIEAARAFVNRLIVTESWTAELQALSRLPASREDLIDLFGNVVAADKFFSIQGCFCVIVLRKGEEVCISDASTRRLPYLEEQPLNKGAYGKVSRVVVAKGHFFDPKPVTEGFEYNVRDLEMARKDYEINNKNFPRAGQEERVIMDKILGGSLRSGRCENIVDNWGSLEIAPDTYSLFMPKAICDLRAYMTEHHALPPARSEAKAEFIACAAGLASGLAFLHGGMKTQEFEDMVCYHMDLKPDNVLIFHEGGRYVWKLSDFGMARVKIRRRGPGGYERERDFNSWFRRRWHQQQPADPSLSATVNRRAEGTYQPPESVSQERKMTTKSDVWSLGCVISVVFAYLEEGGAGVDKYSITRLRHHDSDGIDRFFVKGRFEPSKLHPEVKKWHKELYQSASSRDADEGDAVKMLLDGLENGPLETEQDRRCDAKSVRKMLEATCKKYSQLASKNRQPSSSGTMAYVAIERSWGFSSFKLPWHSHKTDQVMTAKVDRWRISSSEDFKGCEISPQGTLVAYWTDTKIYLYTSQSLHPSETRFSSEYSLGDSESSIWKSISLTETYLVASTTGTTFNCYIFDLRDGPTEDAALCEPQKLVLRRLPEVHRLTISPNSRSLAFVLRQQDDDRGPGSLLFVDRSDVVSLIDRAEASAIDTSILHLGPQPPGWKPPLRLDWPAADVTYLSISNSKDIHLVIRPELTARSREHKIPIVQVSLQSFTMDTLNIESKGFDSSSAVGFFTSFCPLNVTNDTHGETHSIPSLAVIPVAALITREKRLHIQTFNGNNPLRDLQWDVQHYRVLKLLAGRDSDRLLALGTTSANNKILLLELSLQVRAGSGKMHVSAREIARMPDLLYGNVFAARLAEDSDEGGERFVLVATLVGNGGRRAIYKVHLTGPDEG